MHDIEIFIYAGLLKWGIQAAFNSFTTVNSATVFRRAKSITIDDGEQVAYQISGQIGDKISRKKFQSLIKITHYEADGKYFRSIFINGEDVGTCKVGTPCKGPNPEVKDARVHAAVKAQLGGSDSAQHAKIRNIVFWSTPTDVLPKICDKKACKPNKKPDAVEKVSGGNFVLVDVQN